MSREEYQHIPRATTSGDREIAIRLMGDCGLRVAEVLDVCPGHISRMSDGRRYVLEVVGGRFRLELANRHARRERPLKVHPLAHSPYRDVVEDRIEPVHHLASFVVSTRLATRPTVGYLELGVHLLEIEFEHFDMVKQQL